MVNHIFQKIKDAKGSNAKLKIAIDEFGRKHHEYMETCFNFEVYGISGAGIKKAIDYDEKLYGKFEDYGEFLKQLAEDVNDRHWEVRFEQGLTSYNYQLSDVVSSLLKLSGNKQIEMLKTMLSNFDPHEMIWVIRAIQKNMRIGLNLKSYNKVRKEHGMEEIIPRGVQLCGKRLIDDLDDLSYPRIAEYKYDGERCEIDLQKTPDEIIVTLTSRSNSDITERYPEVVSFLQWIFRDSPLHSIKFDSEIISKDFIKLSTRMHRKAENIKEDDDDLKAIVFDILEVNGQSMREMPQNHRRQLLDKYASDYGFDTSYIETVKSVQELQDFYKQARSINQEGVVTKDLDMKWTEHSRDGWIKMVPKENIDLEVIEAYYGTGKFANQINGVICQNRDGTIKTKASSGIKDFERELLTKLHDDGELIGKIVEISYRELTPPKEGVSALRFPVFIRLRDDKFTPDIS